MADRSAGFSRTRSGSGVAGFWIRVVIGLVLVALLAGCSKGISFDEARDEVSSLLVEAAESVDPGVATTSQGSFVSPAIRLTALLTGSSGSRRGTRPMFYSW